jgi:hypothetical protein
MRIWHPEVHALFGERLHYFLLTLRPFKIEAFKESIETFRISNGIGGFYWYEVFGGFDVILRVWLPANLEDKFVDLLRGQIPEVERVIPFKVTRISRYWLSEEAFKGSPSDVLNQVTVDGIRAVQAGKPSEQLDAFLKAKLLVEVEESRCVKFFIALSNPQAVTRSAEESCQKQVGEIINAYRSSGNQLRRASIYFGYGFAWALIKAETPPENYFLVGKIVNDLSQALQGHGFFSTTYLTTGPNFFESDDVSTSSLTLAGGFDLSVARLLPNFYKTDIPEALRNVIVGWVKDTQGIEKLPEHHRELIARALNGVIAQNERAVLSPIQEYFVDQERYLRGKWQHFVSKQVGSKKTPDVLRAAGISEGANPKYFTLGDMCTIVAKTIVMSGKPRENYLVSGWQDVANLRNIVAHGACEPLEEWPPLLNGLIQSFSKLDLLKVNIETALDGHERPLDQNAIAS